MKAFLIVGIQIILLQGAIAQQKCYVALNGSDHNPGSVEKPFLTIARAQQYVENASIKEGGNCQVILRGGTYVLHTPLAFDAQFNTDTNRTIEFTAYKGEKVTISGGENLRGTWVKTNKPRIWKIDISSQFGSEPFFQSLFANGKRLKRACSDTLLSKGALPEFQHLYGVNDFKAIGNLIKDSINVFCAFVYSGNDLDHVQDITAADVIVYNSWEASWHRIYKIDKQNKIIYFKNPATYPVGFFSPQVKYMIENSLDYLNKPGEWYLDVRNKCIMYYAIGNENPNKMKFVVPVSDKLLVAKGSPDKKICNVKFSNINFSYSKSAWGINNILQSYKAANARKFPWLDFNQGFSSVQASVECGAAISLEACNNWLFNNCSFSHLGNYAINIGIYSSYNVISNCTVRDIGGGGILICYNKMGGKVTGLSDDVSPAYNKIVNCAISKCGTIFPSGVGIGLMQCNHTLISHNKIADLPYSGISVGWTFDAATDNYTSYNIIEANVIHDVMKILNDGGGIYTLGKQTGSVYKDNYIYNVFRANHSIGAGCNGFFFDQGSSGFKVDSNVVYNVKNASVRYNQAKASEINLKYNYFQGMNTNTELRNLIYSKVK